MHTSVIGTTYDLLSFHGSGNDGQFERTFDKVCAFYSVDIDSETKKKHRRWAYHFLRAAGYIELVRTAGRWTVAPPALVEIKKSEFVLLGGARETESLEAVVSKKLLKELQTEYTSKLFPVSFFPVRLSFTASKPEALRLGNKTGMQVTFNYQDRLFRYFPRIQTILSKILSQVIDFPIFQANSGQKFNPVTKEWEPHPELQPYAAGLYRSVLEFAAPKYFLVTKAADEVQVFLLKDREWALICLLELFDLKLPLQYSRSTSTLSVQTSGYSELRLPTLLERCLRSGTLTIPGKSIDGKWTKYENINYANIWHLLAKLPIFSVEIT